MSRRFSIDETWIVAPGLCIDFSGTFDVGQGETHPLTEPAHAALRVLVDHTNILTGEITIPPEYDLSGKQDANYRPQLRPCPFCAPDAADMLVWDAGRLFAGRWMFAVVCGGCGTQGPVARIESEAVQMWNLGFNRYFDERSTAAVSQERGA